MILLLRKKTVEFGRLLPVILVVCYAILFALTLKTYIIWQSVSLILGLIILPIVTTIDQSKKSGKRFGQFSIVFMVLAYLMPVKTLLFISMIFAVFFLIEHYKGRVNILPLLVCFFMSPFFQYAVSVFSFSIRLKLTTWAGKLLTAMGDTVKTSGNVIEAYGNEFSVDPACMGLNMMVTSVMLSLVLLGIFQKRYRRYLNWRIVLIVLTIVALLNILSNLLRIILLIKFTILPANTMHEVVGVVCLVVYVFIPVIFLAKFAVKKYGVEATAIVDRPYAKPSIVFQLLMLVLMIAVSVKVMARDKQKLADVVFISNMNGYQSTLVMGNVTKLESPNALVYVKPIGNFYEADHNPMICWKGSGYELKHIGEETVAGLKVFKATLQKDKEVLQTAWWYDNGKQKTTSQLLWRWKMLQQEDAFSIINVTCSSEEELQKQVEIFSRAFIK